MGSSTTNVSAISAVLLQRDFGLVTLSHWDPDFTTIKRVIEKRVPDKTSEDMRQKV